MKKVSVLLIIMSVLSLSMGTAAFGAIHPVNSNNVFFNYSGSIIPYSQESGLRCYYTSPWSERWFTVEPKAYGFVADGTFIKDSEKIFNAEYYRNDQTFASINYISDISGHNTMTNLKGSYLFDCGLFAGLDYNFLHGGSDYYYALISPGYRFNLGNQGYIAASVNYQIDNYPNSISDNNKIISYEAEGVYYLENAKIYGEIALPNRDVYPSGEGLYMAGGNYKVTRDLVCGVLYLNLPRTGLTSIFGGVTYSPDQLIINGVIGSNNSNGSNSTYYEVAASYRFAASFGAGIGYQRNSGYEQGGFSGKLDFYIDNGILEIGFFPENTAIYQLQTITAVYKLNL